MIVLAAGTVGAGAARPAGSAANVKTAASEKGEVAPRPVTRTGTGPSAWAGATARMRVAESTVKRAAGVSPNSTRCAAVSPVPWMATAVPPAAAPAPGTSEVIFGPAPDTATSRRPIRLCAVSTNHSAPSGPVVTSLTTAPDSSAVSVGAPPPGGRRSSPEALPSPTHRAPSGPTVIDAGPAPGTLTKVVLPLVVMRPMRSLPKSVNQTAPSGPTTSDCGCEAAGRAYSVTTPPVVIAPIAPLTCSANHIRPSGPATMVISLLPIPVVGATA